MGKQSIEFPTWRPRSKLSSELQLHLGGSIFTVDKELLAHKSAKISTLLQKSPKEDLSLLLSDIPADQESLELVARFCHGFEIKLSTENVIRVACVSHYLGMTETQSPNNLLKRAISYFEENIISSWNNSIKALKSAENILLQALHVGLIDQCLESVILKVLDDPRLLGEPVKNLISDDIDENENVYRPNARRKLFYLDWKYEDLTILSLNPYVPIIHEMIRRQVPPEYIAANICQYVKKWIFEDGGEEIPVYKKNVIEVLEKLLPHQKGVVSPSFLSEMLKFANALDANSECKNGLEIRIGRQLDQVSVSDLLIPSQGYAKDEQYDTECVRRILKNFYANYTSLDSSGLIYVAELIDEFLAEISADVDLKISTFITFADMSVAASRGTQRTFDGIYRAIDVYLDKHKDLTEMEKEKLCGILDCNKLSVEAREHAAQNERLPLRLVVQVLFLGQLKLREVIVKVGPGLDSRLVKIEEEEEEEEGVGEKIEENVRVEMERMGSKVLELERECDDMRREIERGGKKQKWSVWKGMKRKFGCGTSIGDRDCHVKKKKKKVHPK